MNINDWLLKKDEMFNLVGKGYGEAWDIIRDAQHRKTLEKVRKWAKEQCPLERKINGAHVYIPKGACPHCWRELVEGK